MPSNVTPLRDYNPIMAKFHDEVLDFIVKEAEERNLLVVTVAGILDLIKLELFLNMVSEEENDE